MTFSSEDRYDKWILARPVQGYRSEVFCLFVRGKNNNKETVSGDCLGNNEEARTKWERNLSFNKRFQKENPLPPHGSTSLTCISPLSPSSKATSYKINGQSFLPWFSIESLICNTPKCASYSTVWRKLTAPLLWQECRLVVKERAIHFPLWQEADPNGSRNHVCPCCYEHLGH